MYFKRGKHFGSVTVAYDGSIALHLRHVERYQRIRPWFLTMGLWETIPTLGTTHRVPSMMGHTA